MKTLSDLRTRLTLQFSVYSDPECTVEVKEIHWGTIPIYWNQIEPYSYSTYLVYIKNTGYLDLNLALSTQKWNPPIASYFMVLIWDYGYRTLRPGEVLPVNLTLAVAADIREITNFNFDIVITAIPPPLPPPPLPLWPFIMFFGSMLSSMAFGGYSVKVGSKG